MKFDRRDLGDRLDDATVFVIGNFALPRLRWVLSSGVDASCMRHCGRRSGSTTKLLQTGTVCKVMQRSLLRARSQSNHHAETGEMAVLTTQFSPLDRGTLM
jgi:hypothetical protein